MVLLKLVYSIATQVLFFILIQGSIVNAYANPFQTRGHSTMSYRGGWKTATCGAHITAYRKHKIKR